MSDRSTLTDRGMAGGGAPSAAAASAAAAGRTTTGRIDPASPGPAAMIACEGAGIAGIGIAYPLPPKGSGPLSNYEVIRLCAPRGPRGQRGEEGIHQLGTAFEASLGIAARHWAHQVGTPFTDGALSSVDLGAEALERAMVDADASVEDLGAILAATSTPSRVTGANAPQIAARVGARCMAFDLRSGCTAGLLALVQGHLLATALGQPVAVVASDTFSKLAPPTSALASLAFGDAGAAIIVRPCDATLGPSSGVPSAVFGSDGNLGHLASAPSPFPITKEAMDRGLYFLQGDPEAMSSLTSELYAEVTTQVLGSLGLAPSEVDLFVPHQTSGPAVEAAAAAAGIPLDRTVVTVREHANCGSPTVMMALARAREEGRLSKGSLVLCAVVGGGLAWGAAALRI